MLILELISANTGDYIVLGVGLRPIACGLSGSKPAGDIAVCLLGILCVVR